MSVTNTAQINFLLVQNIPKVANTFEIDGHHVSDTLYNPGLPFCTLHTIKSNALLTLCTAVNAPPINSQPLNRPRSNSACQSNTLRTSNKARKM